MYSVNLKIQRKEGSKPNNELYLVDALTLTDVETKVANEFQLNMETSHVFISKCDDVKFNEIFENGEGTFFIIKIIADNMDGKAIKEVYLQEAENESAAKHHFREKVSYGEITNFNLTNYMGIIK